MTLIRESRKFCLKWNEFEGQLKLVFQHLYDTKCLADVTLQCEYNGRLMEVKAHKVILSIYSPFLRNILSDSEELHPVITLDGVSPYDLSNVLEFVYLGKVAVYKENYAGFVETVKFLRIEGVDIKPSQPVCEPVVDPMLPLNLSKYSPTHSFEYSRPEKIQVHTPPVEVTAGNTSLLRSTVTDEAFRNRIGTQYSGPKMSTNAQLSPYFSDLHNRMYLNATNPGMVPNICQIKPLTPLAFTSYSKINNFERPPKENTAPREERKSLKRDHHPSPPDSTMKKADPNIKLFTTPSGMVVSTAYTSANNPLTLMSNMMKLPEGSQIPPDSTETKSKKRISHRISCQSKLNPSRSIKYTPSQVLAIEKESTEGVEGPFVPCKLCQKVVKRGRLRTHVYECHFINGEKIHCPYCNVALKSKGSYRVHVWRHRKGNLKKSGPVNTLPS